jgi:hypothetical protein
MREVLMDNKKPLRAKLMNGSLRCPICKAQLAKVYYGGFGMGIEIKCKCGRPVFLEVRKQN